MQCSDKHETEISFTWHREIIIPPLHISEMFPQVDKGANGR